MWCMHACICVNQTASAVFAAGHSTILHLCYYFRTLAPYFCTCYYYFATVNGTKLLHYIKLKIVTIGLHVFFSDTGKSHLVDASGHRSRATHLKYNTGVFLPSLTAVLAGVVVYVHTYVRTVYMCISEN